MEQDGFDLHEHKEWDWEPLLETQLDQENNAKISMYGQGVTPFLLYHGRPQFAANCALDGEELSALRRHCAERMRRPKGTREVVEESSHIDKGTVVRVLSTTNTKRKHPTVLGPWSARAVIVEERAGGFYVVRWLTTGVHGEKIGAYSKRLLYFKRMKIDENQTEGLTLLKRSLVGVFGDSRISTCNMAYNTI